ncbi:MAG: endolytic transglycosylase MltG [Deltaproteobacteria bacterium]|nr:endolytic transglycosylase MltG [Deltaproteobacteria bacterium]
MSKRSFRTALAVVVGSLVIVGIIAAVLINRALSYPGEAHEGAGRDVEIEVKTGMSFPQVASMLSDKGVIEKPTWFRLYAMWEGDTTNVKTGKYLIKDNLTPREVLAILVAGVKEVTVKVTLPEGKSMLEYFEILHEARVASAKDLEALARNKDFLARHAISGDSVDGYLFPDTYQFRVGEKPLTVLERLVQRHQEVWNGLVAKHPKNTAKLKDKLGWSDRDILTMASIVEKEAVEPSERPRIAQVFINRLTSPSFKPRKLQTDPTIRYGCLVPLQKSSACIAWNKPCIEQKKPMGCDRLRRAQLDDKDNPYNTYAHEGLPPGPISNPGKASIEATLSPDGSDYFYFVATSKNSRSHAFAKTVEEHERNVKKYVASDSE